ncbi:GreA/GreB family elongation factor [Algoriphagus marincola]|uniref:site-specific DNA-methyltransferase (adenine-specific) n=1 Tax=Algoriphagus marincola TaxID=264027 RepID=A0ABS7N2J9_9BACT|nr:type IIL restriction-modification enzyme MmeI [Algoriphagus marincola]MBY5950546.1 GreA/GreB family elongation factor [Algoriphagus marincola]
MTFPSITIQGNIVSGEILDKITSEDIKHQTPESFGLAKNIKVRDEIGLAWASARGYWQAFKLRRERIAEEESGTTETRNFWMLPFLLTLGYEVDKANAVNLDNKTYAISHRASNLSGFPVHIMGINDSLDKRRETSGPRLSPHALVQEYLNKTDDYLYALVTNGKQLRLLRDATRLVRLTYLEFDLEKMMEEELFADFAVLYRVLHASRLPKEKSGGEESIIEFYHQESLASGTRIREKLSEAVESSIKRLGNGFLKHPENHELRAMVQAGELSGKQYYLYLLRLIYRFLFLLVTEDRSLVYPEKRDAELTRLRKIYYDFYSMDRVRKLALRKIFVEGAKHDLWENIKITFRLFEAVKYGEKLGIKPLGSGIFHPSALGALSESLLKNEDLLFVIHRLCYFMDEDRKQLVKVNYGDLDVEEFGSVYQGLLEFEPVFSELDTAPSFGFVAGTERSSSGSHYTPEELVRPLIQHSLEYIIQDCIEKPEERLKLTTPNAPKPTLQEKALLAIKVCDISCGSGHILLSAARRIGTELAKIRTGEDQPTPTAMRQAVRDVIRECIYGVDKNPLAVELCKVALWLEAHNPGEPLNFLDHKIKCGDAIVGLAHKEELERGIADEAFKALPGDDKTIATGFRKRNTEERKQKDQLTMDYSTDVNEAVSKAIEQFQLFKNLPERTPEEIEAKQRKFMELNKGTTYARLKSLADMQVAQFFIPKTADQKSYICTDATYRKYLREKTIPTGMPPAKAEALAQEKGFFHYFLEFPEVFAESKNPEGTEGSQGGGFDCILGNPPFLGGKKLSGNFGNDYLNFLLTKYLPAGGQSDLIIYFLRRIYSIICKDGILSIISTDTLSQGDTREFGLEQVMKLGGKIIFANPSVVWPGEANLNVTLISISNSLWVNKILFKNQNVKFINSLLEADGDTLMPLKLRRMENQSFKGSYIGGLGFTLSKQEKDEIIKSDSKYNEVIFPYITGGDLNEDINQNNSRWVINFFDWSIEKARTFIDCFKIVEEKVKPERAKSNRKSNKENWWIYAENRPGLYGAIKGFERVIGVSQVTKHLIFSFLNNDFVFDTSMIIFPFNEFSKFSILQSSIHEIWARKYSSTLESRLRYTPSDSFETFPFPDENSLIKLEVVGRNFNSGRQLFLNKTSSGLTKFYNYFHSSSLTVGLGSENLDFTNKIIVEKNYGKEAWNFFNHLDKIGNSSSLNEALKRLIELRKLHREMDEAILEAYGWSDIALRHDFYELEYLPENDRVRYTIHPDARKEILKRLLDLNHQYFEEEARKGLHKQKVVEAFYEQKGQPVPEEVAKWFGKKKGKGPKESKPKPPKPSPQTSLFEATTPLFSQPSGQKVTVGSKVTIRSADAKEMKYIIQASGEKGSFTSDGYKLILSDSALAQSLLGKGEGDQFEFGGVGYRLVNLR